VGESRVAQCHGAQNQEWQRASEVDSMPQLSFNPLGEAA
jgi:hypothetical protein